MACAIIHAETYVTERNVSIDRCGTAWFITRFVDAEAKFEFFETGKTPPPGITYAFFGSKYFNKGPDCTFAVMVKSRKKEGLKALQLMNEQFNDIFAWRAGPDALSRHLREGIAELRDANQSDLETYKRMFIIFDVLYFAYGGDKSEMLPSQQRDMDHLPIRILLEFADGPAFRGIPSYPPSSVSRDPEGDDFKAKVQAIYDQFPLDSTSAAPLDKAWTVRCREHGWEPSTYGPVLSWLERQNPAKVDRKVLQKIYLLVKQRLLEPPNE